MITIIQVFLNPVPTALDQSDLYLARTGVHLQIDGHGKTKSAALVSLAQLLDRVGWPSDGTRDDYGQD